jgi:D-glycero-D-manno-heptose 1,7-bisphosphate phosphatase
MGDWQTSGEDTLREAGLTYDLVAGAAELSAFRIPSTAVNRGRQRAERPAAFLDRDGVIIEDREDYATSWPEVRFLDGAIDALRRLARSPLAIVIVSNQAAVGRGLITLDAAGNLHERIVAEIQSCGGRIDASYLCPHHPDAGCACRKPLPGMLHRAARELDLRLEDSWLVGDALRDMEAAARAGARGILVRTGRGAEQAAHAAQGTLGGVPVVADLAAAVDLILGRVDHANQCPGGSSVAVTRPARKTTNDD